MTECSHARCSSCLYSAYMKEKLFYSRSSSPESSKRMKGGAAETRGERKGIISSLGQIRIQ